MSPLTRRRTRWNQTRRTPAAHRITLSAATVRTRAATPRAATASVGQWRRLRRSATHATGPNPAEGRAKNPRSCQSPTPSCTANADCEIPSGRRNSSNSISPGCVGGRCVGRRRCTSARGRFVVVRDFDVVGIAVLPPEAHPELIVDVDTVRAATRGTQRLLSVPWRNRPLPSFPNAVELRQRPRHGRPQPRWARTARAPAVESVQKVVRGGVGERAYHRIYGNE
jgi:hypothetical protein